MILAWFFCSFVYTNVEPHIPVNWSWVNKELNCYYIHHSLDSGVASRVNIHVFLTTIIIITQHSQEYLTGVVSSMEEKIKKEEEVKCWSYLTKFLLIYLHQQIFPNAWTLIFMVVCKAIKAFSVFILISFLDHFSDKLYFFMDWIMNRIIRWKSESVLILNTCTITIIV